MQDICKSCKYFCKTCNTCVKLCTKTFLARDKNVALILQEKHCKIKFSCMIWSNFAGKLSYTILLAWSVKVYYLLHESFIFGARYVHTRFNARSCLLLVRIFLLGRYFVLSVTLYIFCKYMDTKHKYVCSNWRGSTKPLWCQNCNVAHRHALF